MKEQNYTKEQLEEMYPYNDIPRLLTALGICAILLIIFAF